jgi:hypothetical protein
MEGNTEESLPWISEWLLSRIPEDHPLLQRTTFREDTYYFDPVQPDNLLLSHSQVFQLEQNLMHLGHRAESEGLKTVLEDARSRGFFVQPVGLKEPLPYEICQNDQLYPELPMAYFLAGLEGERPHAQALGFYQVLEYSHCQKEGVSGLQELLQTIPESVLRESYYRAIERDDSDALDLNTAKGKLDKGRMAKLIEDEIRNPSVHAGEAREGQNEAIHPFAMHQFAPRFRQAVRLTRELARFLVGETGQPGNLS